MPKTNDLCRSLTAFEQSRTIIAVIETSLSSWLRCRDRPRPGTPSLKKLSVDPHALLPLLHRWRDEAIKTGDTVARIAVAYEADLGPSRR
jgi:transposase